MKLAIVGSRSYNDYDKFRSELEIIKKEYGRSNEIITGCASGADALARRNAAENSISLKIFKADWKLNGRGAGLLRNSLIVETCDVLLAFWDGKSRGTNDSIDKAKKSDKRTLTILI